jgi:hypothetical protein
MEERRISEQEGLEIISRMIRNTQRKMEQGAGAPMLIWGFATVITTLIVWYMVKSTQNYQWNCLWFLIPVLGTIGMLLMKKPSKGVRTYIDKVIFYIWLVLGCTGLLISCLCIFHIMWSFPILFVIIIIMGMGTILTGLVAGFKPFVVGGILGILIGIAQYIISGYDITMLLFASAFAVMMIIPGFILNYRAQKHV